MLAILITMTFQVSWYDDVTEILPMSNVMILSSVHANLDPKCYKGATENLMIFQISLICVGDMH